MKDLIIMIGSILLGCIIFEMIVGDGISLKTTSGKQMEQLLELYREQLS